MATVHTHLGPGEIIAEETVRGRKSYRVAGQGFDVWLDETKVGNLERKAWAPVDFDNSVKLPYNPDPQFPATPGNTESTIQPIHHIDPDERLHPADSVTFNEVSRDEGDRWGRPGPAPHLFARPHKTSGFYDDPGAPTPHQSGSYGLDRDAPERREYAHPDFADEGHEWEQDLLPPKPWPEQNPRWNDMTPPKPSNYLPPEVVEDRFNDPRFASVHEAHPALMAILPAVGRALAPAVARGVGGAAIDKVMGGGDKGGEEGGGEEGQPPAAGGGGMGLKDKAEEAMNAMRPGYGWGPLIKPSGLSDKYIDITANADYHHNPILQFRHDPDAYISRVGNVLDETDVASDIHLAQRQYMDLVESDPQIREAAWKDVREKGVRLRTDGRVAVHDISPSRIYATVEGDNGIYDVMISREGMYGGVHDGYGLRNWRCACLWGQWAWKRKYSYVGRLCSHGYAAFLEMQSANERKRGYPKRSRKTADALQMIPTRLTPELVINDADDASYMVDVTKDERKDTRPEDVMGPEGYGKRNQGIEHFSSLMALCDRQGAPYPRELVAYLERYAADGDDDNQPWQVTEDGGRRIYRQPGTNTGYSQEGDTYTPVNFDAAGTEGPEGNRYRTPEGPGYTRSEEGDRNLYRYEGGGGDQGFAEENGDVKGVQYTGEGEKGEQGGQRFDYSPEAESALGGAYDAGDAPNTTKGFQDFLRDNPGGAAPAPGPAPNVDAAQNPPDPGNLHGLPGAPTAAGTETQDTGNYDPTSGAWEENKNQSFINSDVYEMQEGDTATNVLNRAYGPEGFEQHKDEFMKANDIADINLVNAGEKYKLPGADTTDSATGKSIATPLAEPTTPGAVDIPDNQVQVTTGGPGQTTESHNEPQVATPATPAAPDVTTPAGETDTSDPNSLAFTGALHRALFVAGNDFTASQWWRQAAPEPSTTDTTNVEDDTDADADTGTADLETGTNADPAATTDTDPAANPATDDGHGHGEEEEEEKTPEQEAAEAQHAQDPSQLSPGIGQGGGEGGGGMGDMGAMMDMAGPMMGAGMDAAGQFAPMITDALGGAGGVGGLASGLGGGLASGIGDAVSGLVSGIGGIFGSRMTDGHGNFIEADRSEFGYPSDANHVPFEGSGPLPPLKYTTSEEEMVPVRRQMEDVTERKSGPSMESMRDKPRHAAVGIQRAGTGPKKPPVEPEVVRVWTPKAKQGGAGIPDIPDPYSRTASSFSGGGGMPDDDPEPFHTASASDDFMPEPGVDIVAQFQRSAAAQAVMSNNSGQSNDDLAGAASAFLQRTAGRNFSMAEQAELMNERHPLGARNLDSLDLAGTHYEAENSVGLFT